MATGFTSVSLRLPSDRPSSDRIRQHSQSTLSFAASDQSSKVLVEARNLRKGFASHLAVKDVSFTVEAGEVLGFLGPNGAGKSTTMLMLAGLITPTSGEVFLQGRKYDGRDLDQRRLFGIVPQEYAIYEELSAIANLKFFGRLYGLRGTALTDRCDEVLEQIGLTDSARRSAGQFSGGMKRRLNFGIALMHKPQILILDEPTLGVDPQSRSHLMDCVRRQTAAGGSVIYVSHYMEEVQSIAQRVVILDQGQVIASDSIHHLLAGLTADLYLYVDRIAGITNELEDLAHLGTDGNGEPVVIVAGNKQRNVSQFQSLRLRDDHGVQVDDNALDTNSLGWRLQSTLRELNKLGIRVFNVETQQSNLEQLFLQLTGKRLRD